MEKEKKVTKEKKVVKVEKMKKDEVQDKVILEKEEKKLIRFISLLTTFFASGLAILIFVFSIIASLSIANLSKEELINNNIVVTLLSKLNNYSITEAKELIDIMSNRFTFILFEVIVPTVAFVGAMLLLIVLGKQMIGFVNDIKTEKDLFNKAKLNALQEIISIISLVLLTTLVLFNEPSIVFYLLIELLLWAVFILFKKYTLAKKDNH